MKWAVGMLVAVMCLLGASAPDAAGLTATPSPVELPASPVLITGYQTSGGLLDFVQLYNTSATMVSLEGWRLEYTATSGSDEIILPISLNSWLLPHQYAVIAQKHHVQEADGEFLLPSDIENPVAKDLVLVPADYSPYVVKGGLADATRYQMVKTDAGNYTASRPFEQVGDVPLYGGGLYAPPDNSPLLVTEIFANARDCAPAEQAADCREFVELYNPTDTIVDTSMYRLRLGYGNTAAGVTNAIHLSGVVAPHERLAVATRDDGKPIDVTASAGNAWLEDAQGLKVYENTVVGYRDIGERKGFSWARNGNGWQWAVVTPGGVNNFVLPTSSTPSASGLKPCDEGQYRSSETHRCRNISTATGGLMPCKAGQYRSKETNRCRNLATTTSTLKPCAPNQTRNPETNRCRSTTSSTSKLTPCKEGQERNPATNRCRNASSVLGDAAYAVEPVKQTGQAFIGWWALGGAGILAVGYAGWEWRHEVSAFIEKTGEFFRTRK